MSKSLREIAEQLKDSNKKVQLIYAFNGVGKTRLSREFKSLIVLESNNDEDTPEQIELDCIKILYYNAFTEDLFYWDNDLDSDYELKLKIQPNSFTDWVLKEQGQGINVINNFQRYTNEKLTPEFRKDFSEVTFSLQKGDEGTLKNLKISKGEESNFIWSIFYTLLEQIIGVLSDSNSNEQDKNQFHQLEYIFIDDPVSSLDENHLIELAVNLSTLIKKSNKKNLDLKFIISTHNPLFYNILYNELNSKISYMLVKNEDGKFELNKKKGDSNASFSYHLYIKQIIERAIKNNDVQRYHFMLLRNLYEKTANFLGYREWSELLPGNKEAYFKRIIQFSNHRTLSNEEVAHPTDPEKKTVELLLNNLIREHGFWQKKGEQDG